MPLSGAKSIPAESGFFAAAGSFFAGPEPDIHAVLDEAEAGSHGALAGLANDVRTQVGNAVSNSSLDALPDSPWRDALAFLARYSVNRNH